ncbi:MAG: endopeptidase IV [Coxiella sp. RIFCSPHIGHO2_12_FULL_44_14]|nr:MAG: endopeptidase IV [Coxiella sp. RIFCSPHIGHO2_12_FULL_44_14]
MDRTTRLKKWLIVLTGILLLMSICLFPAFSEGLSDDEEEAPRYKYYGSELCAYPQFHCIHVKAGDTWEKLFPDQKQREIIKRLNRTNIPLGYRSWIVVPTNLDQVTHMDMSPFPAHVTSVNERFVVVNLGLHAFAAYNDTGNLVYWGPVSGGKGWCPDVKRYCNTAVGAFRVVNKEGPKCVSDVFPIETAGGAPMPYCMYYYRGFALHGSTLPGFHASHGCIRLFPDDARWLNEHFVKIGTRVIVTRS